MNIITKTLIRIKAAIQDIPNGEFFLINGPIYLGIVIYFISVIILGPIFKGYGNVPQIYYGLIFIIFPLPLIMIGLFFAIKKRILPGARSVHMEGWPAVVVASVLFMMCLIAEIIWIWLLISPF